MANHLRTQIRDKVATKAAGLSETGSNVFKSRPDGRPLPSASLPALMVYTDAEGVSENTAAGFPLELDVGLDVRIAILVEQNSGFDDRVDAVLKTLQVKFNESVATFTLDGLAGGGFRYVGCDNPEFSGDGAKIVGRLVTRWRAVYRISAAAPDTPL